MLVDEAPPGEPPDWQPQHGWRFDIQPLRNGHWVSVARGPPEAAIDAFGFFRASFAQLRPSSQASDECLQRPEPRFVERAVADLIPVELRAAYLAAAADEAEATS